MFRKTQLSLLLLSIVLCAKSQSYLGVGIGGGLTSASTSFIAENTYENGYKIDLIYEYNFPLHFIIETGISHYLTRFQSLRTFISENEQQIGGSQCFHSYSYLGVPLKVGYRFGEKLTAGLKVGIMPAYLLKAQRNQPSAKDYALQLAPSKLYVEDNELVNVDASNAAKFNLSGLAEIIFQYELSDKSNVFVSFNYMKSLTTVTNDNYLTDTSISNYGFYLNLGYKYKLNN